MLSLQGVTSGYRRNLALRDVSLEVAPGETLALLGNNGSGKTTLVRTVLGLVPLLSGRIEIDGRPFSRSSQVGYVPQRHTVSGAVPSSVFEVVASGLLTSGNLWRPLSRSARSRVMTALGEVGMEDFSRRRLQELSGGQARRVLIARALVKEPPLVILDEPTAGVDRTSTQQLVASLAALKSHGHALVVVTHDLPELGDLWDRAITLQEGRIHEVRANVPPLEPPVSPVTSVPDSLP